MYRRLAQLEKPLANELFKERGLRSSGSNVFSVRKKKKLLLGDPGEYGTYLALQYIYETLRDSRTLFGTFLVIKNMNEPR